MHQLLTNREREVLTEAAKGYTNQNVADTLYLSKRTIDFHLANAYEKLGVNNKISAVNKAIRLGEILDVRH